MPHRRLRCRRSVYQTVLASLGTELGYLPPPRAQWMMVQLRVGRHLKRSDDLLRTVAGHGRQPKDDMMLHTSLA